MNLTINQKIPGCADGNYHVKAKGCIAASLHWADENGALSDWQPFAYLPIETNGVGMYKMVGGRAIPTAATYVLARAVSADFSSVEECLVPIQKLAERTIEEPMQHFLVMTDLHLSNKPWKVRKALTMAQGYDAVLITGDMTNDGTQEQLELFWDCVTELLPYIPVFAVTGNHDYPKNPLPQIQYGICDYPALQQKLLERAEAMGCFCEQDSSGAYVVRMGNVEIFGLNAANHWRRFKFPEGEQLLWLQNHLEASTAKQRIILCHAPLLAHRPYRQPGDAPYLSMNAKLQQIVDDQQSRIIFISGHTHVSMNCREGCVERDDRNHVYINAGSIRPTTLKPEEPLQPECWTEGNVVELLLREDGIRIRGISVKDGGSISRGYYRFADGYRK